MVYTQCMYDVCLYILLVLLDATVFMCDGIIHIYVHTADIYDLRSFYYVHVILIYIY